MSFNSSYEDQIPEYTHQVNIRIGMLTGEEELCFEKTKVKKNIISIFFFLDKVQSQLTIQIFQLPITKFFHTSNCLF